MKTTKYWIQALEDGQPKIVPHTGKNKYQFIQLKTANDFLNELRKNNPETQFRLVTCKEEYSNGPWNDPR
jgi:hypothetical protein